MEANETAPIVETSSSATDVWADILDLPCQLTVEVAIPRFTIADLLALDINSLVDTQRKDGTHVPVNVNGEMIGWAEFDVVDERLAVRLTELT